MEIAILSGMLTPKYSILKGNVYPKQVQPSLRRRQHNHLHPICQTILSTIQCQMAQVCPLIVTNNVVMATGQSTAHKAGYKRV